MAQARKAAITEQFDHPAAGLSRRDPRYIAIRWKPGARQEDKLALLRAAGAELVPADPKAPPPLPQVNQTEGLSWVQGAGGANLEANAIATLEGSDIVEWVSAGYRGAQADSAVFAVNPTRVYVKEAPLGRAGGLAALGPLVRADAQRPARLKGYVTVLVDRPSLVEGRTAIEVAAQARASLASAGAAPDGAVIKYETIPFLSPATGGCGCAGEGAVAERAVECRPPSSEFTPNDPMFGIQWGLQRTNVPRAWEIARGSAAVTVAVIDEGVQLDHPDLLLHPQSWNASSDTPDGSPTGNHGTACAGIAAARLDNGQGVAGAAGGVQVMAIATATWADVDIAEGLYFAADNGARVVSMSFGVYASWGFWDFDLIEDALQYAYDKGLVLVAASGNEDGAQARFPGSDARTLCVGGSNRSDERKRIGDSSSENWWGASYGPDVDVVAPCLEMPTTDRLAGDGYDAGDYFDRFNGTSSATPLVSGIAALLISQRPSLTNVEVRRADREHVRQDLACALRLRQRRLEAERHLEQRGGVRARERGAGAARRVRARRDEGRGVFRLRRQMRLPHAAGLPRPGGAAVAALRPLPDVLRGPLVRSARQPGSPPAGPGALRALPAAARTAAGTAALHDHAPAGRDGADLRVRPLPTGEVVHRAGLGAHLLPANDERAVAKPALDVRVHLRRHADGHPHPRRHLGVGRRRPRRLLRRAAGEGRDGHRDRRRPSPPARPREPQASSSRSSPSLPRRPSRPSARSW